jgi:arylsulfatase A-like enzyme
MAGVFDFHLARAETSETWARTAFVLTAPSGTDLLREQARLGHARALSPDELDVPIVLRHPDSLTGERIFDEVVGLVDVLPTVCEWLDVEPPEQPAELAGRSLFGVTDAARGRSFEERRAFATLVGRMHAVRTPRWHMIQDPELVRVQALAGVEPAHAPQLLFDAHDDPHGRRDVAAEHPDEVARLAALIAAWVEREGRP